MGWKEIMHYGLLRPGKTIDSNVNCQQLTELPKPWKNEPKLVNRKKKASYSTIGTSDHIIDSYPAKV